MNFIVQYLYCSLFCCIIICQIKAYQYHWAYDGISNKLIKRCKESLTKPLTLLINQMISSGIFPEQLKISRIKPLYKAGDTTIMSNYRPISLLPSMSKIFEYVLFHQLYDYMNDNKLLCVQQYGFRSGHSTELAALKLVNHLISNMDDGHIPINIYIVKSI